MKRPTLTYATQWIALNDNAGNGDELEHVRGYVTTLLVADLFDVSAVKVAENIMKIREGETWIRVPEQANAKRMVLKSAKELGADERNRFFILDGKAWKINGHGVFRTDSGDETERLKNKFRS